MGTFLWALKARAHGMDLRPQESFFSSRREQVMANIITCCSRGHHSLLERKWKNSCDESVCWAATRKRQRPLNCGPKKRIMAHKTLSWWPLVNRTAIKEERRGRTEIPGRAQERNARGKRFSSSGIIDGGHPSFSKVVIIWWPEREETEAIKYDFTTYEKEARACLSFNGLMANERDYCQPSTVRKGKAIRARVLGKEERLTASLRRIRFSRLLHYLKRN